MYVDSTSPTLPSDLLHAISAPGGGRVVLVLGAGCSSEEPTSLPLSGRLSEECHRKLVEDGILNAAEVQDKFDLSAVAEAVFGKTGSQRDLVVRFPPDAFRSAKPNDGYVIMAALVSPTLGRCPERVAASAAALPRRVEAEACGVMSDGGGCGAWPTAHCGGHGGRMMNKPCRRPEGRGPSARYSVHSLPLSSSASPPYLPFGGGQGSQSNIARTLAHRLQRRQANPDSTVT